MKTGTYKRYSETVSDSVRQAVLAAVAPAGTDHLYSDTFTDLDGTRNFANARRSQSTGLWTVTLYLQGHDHTAIRILLDNICVFDALHALAWFETSEKALHQNKSRALSAGHTHYREYAQTQMDIAFDHAGFPLPVENGAVMVSADYDAQAAAIIERTRGKISATQKAPDASSLMSCLPAIGKPAGRNVVDAAREQKMRSELSEKLKRVIKGADDVVHEIWKAGDIRFKYLPDDYSPASRAAGAAFGISFVSALPLAAACFFFPALAFGPTLGGIAATGSGLSLLNSLSKLFKSESYRVFDKECRKLDAAAKELPVQFLPEKAAVAAFNKAAAATFILEHAAMYHDLCKNPEKIQIKNIQDLHDRGLKLVKKAARIGGFSDNDTARLMNAFTQGAFPDRGSFASKLRQEHLANLNSRIEAQIKALTPEVIPA